MNFRKPGLISSAEPEIIVDKTPGPQNSMNILENMSEFWIILESRSRSELAFRDFTRCPECGARSPVKIPDGHYTVITSGDNTEDLSRNIKLGDEKS